MATESFSDALHSLAVLEQVCSNRKVLELYKTLTEWTNALNDCLSLCKAVAREVETARFLGQEDWVRFMDVICSESKNPELFPEALAVLKKSFESDTVLSSVSNRTVFKDCFAALKQLAECIEDDHRSGTQLGSTLWKELRRIVKQNAFVLPEISPIPTPVRNFVGSTYKDKLLSMPLEDKRKLYACSFNFKTLSDIPSWQVSAPKTGGNADEDSLYAARKEINEKVSLFEGDITTLEIDAIVNSTDLFTDGGGVDGAIHRAAGPALAKECRDLKDIEIGKAKITGGYLLPARYVIHTTGPAGKDTELLQRCYKSCLKICYEKKFKTIAFPCISTGAHGYPKEQAAVVALKTVREYLQVDAHSQRVDRIIFCVFETADVTIYKERLQFYFPV